MVGAAKGALAARPLQRAGRGRKRPAGKAAGPLMVGAASGALAARPLQRAGPEA